MLQCRNSVSRFIHFIQINRCGDDANLFAAIRNRLAPHVTLLEAELHVNAPAFADVAPVAAPKAKAAPPVVAAPAGEQARSSRIPAALATDLSFISLIRKCSISAAFAGTMPRRSGCE